MEYIGFENMDLELDKSEIKSKLVYSESLGRIATSLINSIVQQANAIIREPKGYTETRESVYKFANEFVENILEESLKRLELVEQVETVDPAAQLFPKTLKAQQDDPSMYEFANNFIANILEESTKRTDNFELQVVKRFQKYNSPFDFKVRDGMELVARCISRWPVNPNWHLEVRYGGKLTTEESHSFFYTVKLSVPSQSYPVAQVTVDVYFTVEVLPMTSPPVTIELWYRLETDRARRRAFTTNFSETWLHTIIKRKLQALQCFEF